MRTIRLPAQRLRGLCLTVSALAIAACGGGGGGGASGPIINTSPAGSTATQSGSLATWILVGGTTKPAYTDVFLDSNELNPGEVFIITQSPLTGGATYQVAIDLTAGTEHYANTWTFTVGGSTATSDAIGTLNALRAEAGVPAMSTVAATVTSSTKHAGYQAIENGGLTHVEPDTANPLFVADLFYTRINDANGGPNNWLGNTESEDIASLGGPASIPLLWDTVYHRLPMMRADTDMVGFGDRDAAIAAYNPAAGVPAASAAGSTGWGYATLDFAGTGAAPTTASFWPNSGTTDVPASFVNTSETPQPIGGTANPNGTTGNPSVVGPPIHIILPTTSDFNAMTVSVTQK